VTNDYVVYIARSQFMPILDRTRSYTVNFTVQILSESHLGSDRNNDGQDDRAGFSVTLLSSDAEGIELGFWQNQIWAQADGAGEPVPLLTHAEGVTFTTTALTSYQLAVRANRFALFAGGRPIFSGSLRNYSAFTPPPGLPNPYTSTNFLSLGDNSSSARARIKLIAVSMTTPPNPIAEPALTYLPLIFKNFSRPIDEHAADLPNLIP
jgi:hypothetical protein